MIYIDLYNNKLEQFLEADSAQLSIQIQLRDRPFDILGGAWYIYQKNFLSLDMQEKNNLAHKEVQKNNPGFKSKRKK